MSLIDRILGNDRIDDEVPENRRVRGKIIKLSDKGFGFITSKEIPFTRIFFHWSSLKQNTLKFPELEEGMWVEFETIEVPERGTRAIRIEVVRDE